MWAKKYTAIRVFMTMRRRRCDTSSRMVMPRTINHVRILTRLQVDDALREGQEDRPTLRPGEDPHLAHWFPATTRPPESRQCRRGPRPEAGCARTPRTQSFRRHTQRGRRSWKGAARRSGGYRKAFLQECLGHRRARFLATNARTSSTPRVLSTCSGLIHPRRAVPTPKRICR